VMERPGYRRELDRRRSQLGIRAFEPRVKIAVTGDRSGVVVDLDDGNQVLPVFPVRSE